MPPKYKVCENLQVLAEQAAQYCLELAQRSVNDHGAFYVALAGGSTPRQLHQTLTKSPYMEQMSWPQTHVFFGDERSVSTEHADSNFRMAKETLLSKVPIPEDQIFPLKGELATIRQAAANYQNLLDQHLPKNDQGIAQFDLILLGMGADGHTASLFPGTCILHEQQHWVAANYVDQLNTWRISLTYPLINAASHIAILAAGAGKAATIKQIFSDCSPPYPIQRVRAQTETMWFLDQAAASEITQL